MASSSRAWIMSRRGAPIQDMSGVTLRSGELTPAEAVIKGVYKVNCKHQIGIATATEVGLSADRYPTRVVLANADYQLPEHRCVTACSYWRIGNVNTNAIPFNRKALDSENVIGSLYKNVPNLDDKLWDHYTGFDRANRVNGYDQESNARMEAIYAACQLQNPTADQSAELITSITNHITACTAAMRDCRFRVTETAYLYAIPAGLEFNAVGNKTPDEVALEETLVCMHVNQLRLRAKYTTLQEGVVTAGAYAISAMFRYGMYESFEHQEYYTVVVTPVVGADLQYRITSSITPRGAPVRAELAVNQVLDISEANVSMMLVEYSNLLVTASGLMHYMYNHTTGGTIVTGSLLSALCMYGFISSASPHEEQVDTTSLLYECLHPTNKRALANIFFRTSGVYTHGKSITGRRYEQMVLDSFTALRANPYPAGSHKAFICLEALGRVLDAGIGPFLPWADQLDACITMCENVLKSGARAHIGASYYTGSAPMVQPSSIDTYLPDLAMFMDTFHKGDSLSMSPHLSKDISKRAGVNWQNMLKALKAHDVSDTPIDVVREFLSTAGRAHFTFDPQDDSTWAGTIQQAHLAGERIHRIFK